MYDSTANEIEVYLCKTVPLDGIHLCHTKTPLPPYCAYISPLQFSKQNTF
jgi:hypothetical protein